MVPKKTGRQQGSQPSPALQAHLPTFSQPQFPFCSSVLCCRDKLINSKSCIGILQSCHIISSSRADLSSSPASFSCLAEHFSLTFFSLLIPRVHATFYRAAPVLCVPNSLLRDYLCNFSFSPTSFVHNPSFLPPLNFPDSVAGATESCEDVKNLRRSMNNKSGHSD